MLELKAEIKEIWETKLKEIRASFKSARKESGTVVEDVWSDLVQCQIDHPCCSYNEVYWRNNVI